MILKEITIPHELIQVCFSGTYDYVILNLIGWVIFTPAYGEF
jgi:hypothetical protein